MKTLSTMAALAALLTFAPPVAAQSAPAEAATDELRAIAAEAPPTDADRRVIERFLEREDVADAARDRDVDLHELQEKARTLDHAAAADIAERIRESGSDQDPVGGDAVVISSSAIVIALLILILVNVA